MNSKIFRAILLALWAMHLNAQNDVTARLDALMTEAAAKDVFSGNVLVFKDNKPLFQKTTGMADYENRLLSDADKLRLFNDPLFPRQYATWEELKKEGHFATAGGGPGVSAVYGRNFTQNRTVIVLSNYDEFSAEMLFQRIGAILNGQPAEPLQPSASKFIYNLLNEKGAAYLLKNDKENAKTCFQKALDLRPGNARAKESLEKL